MATDPQPPVVQPDPNAPDPSPPAGDPPAPTSPPDAPADAAATLGDATTTSDTTETTAPAMPAGDAAAPGAPDPAPAGAAGAPPPTSPQLGGTTPDQRLAEAAAAADDPGYVVSKPILTTGDFGHHVAVLCFLLDQAGHPNPVAAGLSEPVLTDEIMRHVREFQEANGIDPAAPQRGVVDDPNAPASAPLVRRDHEGIVEAATWAALLESAGADVDAELKVDIRYPAGSFA